MQETSAAPDGRTALLRALGEVATEKGVHAVGLREVARRAGLSHAAPTHFFGGHDGMLTAFALEGLVRMDEELCAAQDAAEHLPGHERLVADGMAFVAFAVEHPAWFDAIFRSASSTSPALSDARKAALDGLRALVEEVIDDGAIEAADAMAVTVELWATAHGLASLWVDGVLPSMSPDGPMELVRTTLTEQVERMRPAG